MKQSQTEGKKDYLNKNHKFNVGDVVEVINKKSHEYRQFGKIFYISRRYYSVATPRLFSLHKEADLKLKQL